MRRGCVASEELVCDNCHRAILYASRYLMVDEEDGVEVEKGTTVRLCLDCSKKKGYAKEVEGEKGEKTLTFFP